MAIAHHVPVMERGNGRPPGLVDLAARDLKPGDALRIRIVAVDNSPWAQRGVSRELVIRVPTMEERRTMARSAADSAVSRAQQAIAAQKSLEQRTDEAVTTWGDLVWQPVVPLRAPAGEAVERGEPPQACEGEARQVIQDAAVALTDRFLKEAV